MRLRTTPGRRPGWLLATALATTLAVSACGTADTATDEPAVAALDTDAATSDTQDASTSDGDDNSEPPSDADIERAELQYQQCLEDNGISTEGLFEDSGGEVIAGDDTTDGEGMAQELETDGDFEAVNAAFEECDALLEDVYGAFTPSPEEEAALQDAQAAFETCMADNGMDIDTSGQGGIVSFEIETGEEDDFEQIIDECSEAFTDIEEQFAPSEDGGS